MFQYAPCSLPYLLSKNCMKIRFPVMLLTDKQIIRQTNRDENITFAVCNDQYTFPKETWTKKPPKKPDASFTIIIYPILAHGKSFLSSYVSPWD